jgi:hypothetical protein
MQACVFHVSLYICWAVISSTRRKQLVLAHREYHMEVTLRLSRKLLLVTLYQIPRPDHPPPPYVKCSKVGGDRLKSQKSLLIELAIAFNSTSDTGDTWQVVLIKTSTTYSITGQMYTNLSTSIWPFHKNSLELKSSPALIVRSVSNHSQLFAAAVRLVHILTVVVIFYLSNAQCNVENEK